MTKRKSRAQRAAEIIERIELGFDEESLTMAASAKLIGQLQKLRDVAVPQLIEKLRSSDRGTRRLAGRLLVNLDDASAVAPLRELLDDDSLTQEQKGDILPALELLGSPIDDATFRLVVPHPGRQIRGGLRDLLEEIEKPEVAEIFLKSMGELAPELQADTVRSALVSIGDRRLLSVFAALLHHELDDVILVAIDGIERVKEPATIPLLKERAQYDPSPRVRSAAQRAVLRLEVRTADRTPRDWVQPVTLPLAHCLLTTIDGSGGQVLFISRSLPSGDYSTVNALFNDREGLKDWFGLKTDDSMLAEMMDGFAPIEFVEISLERARNEVERAHRIALQAGRRLPPAYLLYQRWLEGDDAGRIEEHPLPFLDPADVPGLVDVSGDLLDCDEFESWFFDPDEVEPFVDRYARIIDIADEDKRLRALAPLLQEAITVVVDETYRRLLPERLRRQAWLLTQLYDDEQEPLTALAAARAMEAGLIIEHPLLLAMMEFSLLNALDAQ